MLEDMTVHAKLCSLTLSKGKIYSSLVIFSLVVLCQFTVIILSKKRKIKFILEKN